MPKSPEQIAAWKADMARRKAEKAEREAQAANGGTMTATLLSPAVHTPKAEKAKPEASDFDPLEGIPEEARKALRNVTLKEGAGIAFDMALETLEAKAKALWPDYHTVLVPKEDMGGRSKVAEYESYGYGVLEDGSKSRHTVPSSDMVRMGCDRRAWEDAEALRVREQNERHGQFTASNAPEGTPFMERQGAKPLSDILAGMPEGAE